MWFNFREKLLKFLESQDIKDIGSFGLYMQFWCEGLGIKKELSPKPIKLKDPSPTGRPVRKRLRGYIIQQQNTTHSEGSGRGTKCVDV